MALRDTVSRDMTLAQKAGDAMRLETLRFVVAQLHNREIEKRSAGKPPALSDEDTLEVLRKEAKKRREAIALYEKGDRGDLAAKEKAELSIIESYLPAQLGASEVEAVVDELWKGGLADFNSLIREAMKRLKGQADGALVSEVIKKKLGK